MIESSHAVFLSYASQDQAAAERICAALRTAGIEVWFDQSELRGGDAWDQSIRRQIKSCALFIPIISRNTHTRAEGYFRLEWKLAVDRSHLIMANKAFLLPVVIDDTADDDQHVPEKFHDVQWTRLPGGVAQPEFAARIKHLLTPESMTPSAGAPASPVYASATAMLPPSRMRRPKLAAIVAVLTCVAVYLVIEGPWLPRHATGPQLMKSPAAVPAITPEILDKSIAVLPFVDMSEKHDQEYFSDGLTEELIDQLAEAPNLKVIARTSSFQFKGKNEDVRTIAGKLGVAHLLEGSVRKSGTALRITAQLVRASDGTHLWSHTYDRTLKDVFQVQDEIARTVVQALTGALDAATMSTTVAGMAADVHDLILKGNYVFGRGSPGDTESALGYYQRAVALDPNNAQGWTLLGKVHHWQGILRTVSISTARANAFGDAQRALEIDPGSAATHRLLGLIYDHFDWNWSSARREYQRSVELSMTSLDRALAASDVAFFDALRAPGADRVIELMERNIALDPLNSVRYMQLSYWQLIAQRTTDAITTSKKLLELNPTAAGAYAHYGLALIMAGRASEALEAAKKESDPGDRLASLVVAYWANGKRVESDAALNELVKYGKARPTDVAGALAYRGNRAGALDWLEQAFREHDTRLQFLRVDPLYKGLRAEPRFKSLLSKMKLDS